MSDNKKKITIIDIGISNLLSLKNALEFCGAKVVVTNKREIIKQSSKIILPGVGSFEKGLKNIEKLRIKDLIVEHCTNNKYFLGICLGMQLLFEESYENGHYKGLGILKGSIKKLPVKNNIKLPHLNWNKVDFKIAKNNTLFKNIKNLSTFYFAHSYYAKNVVKKNILGQTRLGNFTFPSVINIKNTYGIQFHAEKSSKNGISMLKNFINLKHNFNKSINEDLNQ